jgi:hypothetical protein
MEGKTRSFAILLEEDYTCVVMPPIIFKFLKRNVIAQKPTQGEGIVTFVYNYLHTFTPAAATPPNRPRLYILTDHFNNCNFSKLK